MPASRVMELARIYRMQHTGEAQRIRERAGISARALARELRVSEVTLGRWEAQKMRPREAVALRWLAVLDQLAAVTDQDDDQEELATASA
jgi:DNA-binding transcriptional regulator YiaG